MRAITFLTLLISFAAINKVNALYGWYELPVSTEERMNKCSFPSAKSGWIVGMSGAIYQTSDSGKSWRKQASTATSELKGVHFIDDNIGWAVGAAQFNTRHSIYRTTNGGISWIGIDPGEYFVLNDVYFIDAYTGWACGNDAKMTDSKGIILLTYDGGQTWDIIRTETGRDHRAIHFSNQNNGFISGGFGRAGFSSNGGSSWNIKEVEGSGSGYFYSAFSLSGSTGWISGVGGRIFKTTNGGGTWVMQETNINSAIYSITFINANKGWACTADGKILTTSNSGQVWSEQEIEIKGVKLIDISMVNQQTGYILGNVGNSTKLFRTVSAGETVEQKINAKISVVGSERFCEGDSALLIANPIGEEYNYEWSTGESTDRIIVKSKATYKVIITNKFGVSDSASVSIDVIKPPNVEIEGENLLCEGDSLILSSKYEHTQYKWSSDEINSSIVIKKPGIYVLEAQNENGCKNYDTLNIDYINVGAKFSSDELIFENAIIGASQEKTQKIKNIGDYTIILNDIFLASDRYFTVLTEINLPLTLMPNDEIDISIIFKPESESTQNDTLFIQIEEPCFKYFYFPLKGVPYVSVKENTQSQITLQPNPAGEYIEIDVGNRHACSLQDEIKIYNTLGELIFSDVRHLVDVGHLIKIDISHLPAGLYYLRFGSKGMMFVKM